MEPKIACIPCIVRQGTDVVSRLADSGSVKKSMIKEILRVLADTDIDQPPPLIAAAVHRTIRKGLSSDDPYAESKLRSNHLALSVLAQIRSRIDASTNPLGTALRVAAAANIIDFAVHSEITPDLVLNKLEEAFERPFDAGLIRRFKEDVEKVSHILYITDNAGEIVFDSLLMDYLPQEKITVGVRGEPVLNDATLRDAELAGLTAKLPAVGNGTDIPGTCLDQCSEEFRRVWDRSDLVIAKGQGNFETLAGCGKSVYFMFTAKCRIVADMAGVPIGTVMLYKAIN